MDGPAAGQRRPLDFRSDTSADLLGYIALKEGDEASAREALEEFCARHRQWLVRAVTRSRLCQLLGEGRVEDVVQEALVRVWDRAGTFDASAGDNEGHERTVRAWLGRIANNVAASMLRSFDAMAIAQALPEDVELAQSEVDPETSTIDIAIAREELEKLPDREKDVVLEWLLHFKLGAQHQRMPNAVSQKLAERWSTTTENIRQIRSRTLRALRDVIGRRTGRLP